MSMNEEEAIEFVERHAIVTSMDIRRFTEARQKTVELARKALTQPDIGAVLDELADWANDRHIQRYVHMDGDGQLLRRIAELRFKYCPKPEPEPEKPTLKVILLKTLQSLVFAAELDSSDELDWQELINQLKSSE